MGGRGRGRDGEGREAVKLEKMRGGGTAGGAAEIAAPRNSPPLYGANCIKVRWERPERGGSEARQLLDVVRLALLRWRAPRMLPSLPRPSLFPLCAPARGPRLARWRWRVVPSFCSLPNAENETLSESESDGPPFYPSAARVLPFVVRCAVGRRRGGRQEETRRKGQHIREKVVGPTSSSRSSPFLQSGPIIGLGFEYSFSRKETGTGRASAYLAREWVAVTIASVFRLLVLSLMDREIKSVLSCCVPLVKFTDREGEFSSYALLASYIAEMDHGCGWRRY